MYYKKKSNIIFRDYGSFGYITDNRNFGYKQERDNRNDIGDKVVSKSGSIFLSVLEKEPQTLDYLAEKVSVEFEDVGVETIKADLYDFYELLELDGFIVSAETVQECNEKDISFSYKEVTTKSKGIDCLRVKDSTQDFFDNFFQNEPMLTNLHIEITSTCNERCVHCYIPHENKITSMESNLFYNILEQCKKMNVLHLTISGGEPMNHIDFIGFLKKCNEYNFSVNILSNLTMMDDAILEEMKENHLLGVQVSLYSMNAKIHDEITQIKGSFEKTKEAILKLIENNIPLQISCPIMRQNINCYKDVIEWGKEHNVSVGTDYVIIARYDHTTQNLDNRLNINDIGNIIHDKIKSDPQYIESMERETEIKQTMSHDDFICSVCHSSICISESGCVYPCAGWQDYVVGNVNELSLEEIWRNSKKVKYLRDLRKKNFPECVQCSEKEYCTMCMVRNANEDPLGNPLAVNKYFCNIAKLTKNIYLDWKNSTNRCSKNIR